MKDKTKNLTISNAVKKYGVDGVKAIVKGNLKRNQ